MLPALVIGASLLGGFLRANAARRAAYAQAAEDERNARLTELAAADAKQRGAVRESAIKTATGERVSSDKAQLGAAGVDTQSGSAVDSLAGVSGRGALAALVARTDATREAWGYETRATNLHQHAAYSRQLGDESALSSVLMGGLNGIAAAYPIMRIGEPTTFEMGGPYAGQNLDSEDVPGIMGAT